MVALDFSAQVRRGGGGLILTESSLFPPCYLLLTLYVDMYVCVVILSQMLIHEIRIS